MTLPTWDQPTLPDTDAPVAITVPLNLNGAVEDNWTRIDKYRYWFRQLDPTIVFVTKDVQRWTKDSIKTVYNTMQQLYTNRELERVGEPSSGEYRITAKLKAPTGRTQRMPKRKKAPVPKIRVKAKAKPKATNDTFEVVGSVQGVPIVRNVRTHDMFSLKELVLK